VSFETPGDGSRDPGRTAERLGERSDLEEEGGEERAMREGEERGSFSGLDEDGDSGFQGFEKASACDGFVLLA